ncbi:alpha/beta hydrolase [Halalkalibacterium halodurans]|jgi:lysophospholipase|uniref:Lysophospholipase n=2 Tax=Halalkalibacterium halodurans TaxID=86665 RepID=Q9K7S1_HALH5|nr:alpha/beta hydrolase [Halalkalibacterium halodurans]MDY7223821.1 alpha/beta hydrolase [Halalkalibacterium halodurans]MDY7243042.1 alpha/beta hydrolase [Halalkalibacterium halodurans]MED3646842.1 alpha/beta hydrolase [Halalkalibacterium halodurans]MED4079961.1 alpha/beta hydrolase [Halalkalibacterium halodurans]MED4084467.1 alpha/beta hydrolase [Halalkalibacterium halodurans]
MWKWEVAEPRGVVVVIHGAGEHHGRYQWLAKKFNSIGLSVVMGDLPGQGRTRGKRGHIQSFQQYIDVVLEWVEAAKLEHVPIFLFGHSMGGLVAVRTMIEGGTLPVRAVILSSPCFDLYQSPGKGKELASKMLHRVTPTFSHHSGIRSDLVTRNEEIREAYLKDELRVTKVSTKWYYELSKAMRDTRRYPEKFPNVPLLVMQAGEDYITDRKAAWEWFNSVQVTEKAYKEWNGLYHEIFNEPEREAVFQYTCFFIEQQLS